MNTNKDKYCYIIGVSKYHLFYSSGIKYKKGNEYHFCLFREWGEDIDNEYSYKETSYGFYFRSDTFDKFFKVIGKGYRICRLERI
jgi:hypothetical protein